MPVLHVNDYELAYAEAGRGRPLLMVHGSLCDQRYWKPQMAAFAASHHAIAVSLRHCWPETWSGDGDGYSIDQHVDDLIAFIDRLGAGPVDLISHSRGGHVAYQLAVRAPEQVRRLVLAEPGGMPDDDAEEICRAAWRAQRERVVEAARLVGMGQVEDGLAHFIDGVSGQAIWQRMVGSFKQMARDNARTLLGQVREPPVLFSKDAVTGIHTPTLLIGGALTPDPFPATLDWLERLLPDARRVTIPAAPHAMNLASPGVFNAAVQSFLAA